MSVIKYVDETLFEIASGGDEKTFYIYTLHASNDPLCKPRYIGFTRDPRRRAAQHNSTQNNGRKRSWAKSVFAAGGKVILTLIFSFKSNCLLEQGAIEGRFINLYRNKYPDLLNDGGAGRGIAPCSEKQKNAVRLALTGIKRPKGRKLSQEHKDRISEGNRGKKRSPENAEKCRRARRGIPHSPEIRKKISEGGKGKKRSPEQLERYRIAARKRYSDPAQKAKFDAARDLWRQKKEDEKKNSH